MDDFQDHSWRRELCGELEALKQDLAELHGEEYEEIPDTIMGPDGEGSAAWGVTHGPEGYTYQQRMHSQSWASLLQSFLQHGSL